MHATLYYFDLPVVASEALAYLSDEFLSSRPLVQARVACPAGTVPRRDSSSVSIDLYIGRLVEGFARAGLGVSAGKSMVVVERAWGDVFEMLVIMAIESITGVMPWIVMVDYEADGTYRETLVLDTAILDRLRK